MKIINIPASEFNTFSENHPLSNFYQTEQYGILMSNFGFSTEYIGIIHNEIMIGASLILNRPIFLGFKYGYAPRGLLIDYNNYELIPDIMKHLKNYLLKKAYLILKIDPLIVKSIRNKDGNIIKENDNFDNIMINLKKAGFYHCGFNNYMEAVKPRWHALIEMNNKSPNIMLHSLKKNIRNKLKKASKFGIEIYKDPDNNIVQLYEFVKSKGNYSEKYYQNFFDIFREKFEIYLARINTESYVKNSKFLYEKQVEINDYLNTLIQNETLKGKNMRSILNKKMESDKILNSYKNHLIRATALLKLHPEGLIIGASVVINYGNKIYLLIDGYIEEYKNLCPGYLTKWKIMEKYSNQNINFFDLNAISGDFSIQNEYKGLNESKLGYDAVAVEYIGEFNLIINKTIYSLYRSTKEKYNIKNQKK